VKKNVYRFLIVPLRCVGETEILGYQEFLHTENEYSGRKIRIKIPPEAEKFPVTGHALAGVPGEMS